MKQPVFKQSQQSFTAHPLWAIVAAFGAYFCMYGFRKPFTAAGYEETELWGLGFKSVLVMAQTLGYAFSKWIGIKVIAEIKPGQRVWGILGLIGFAHLMLLFFGWVPRPWCLVFLFLNGLPLGMVYGLVQSFLEGRRLTEVLIAGLCASFIMADGATKSVGAWLLELGMHEDWMPFLAGCLFALPLLLFVWMLTRIPPPSAADIAYRAERVPMLKNDRTAFFRRYAPGLVGLSIAFLMSTLLRSVRADFAPEIWAGLGYTGIPTIYSTSEFFVLLGVILSTGFGVLLKNNRTAFFSSLLISMAGFLMVPLAIVLLQAGLDGFLFMVLMGLGVYIPYVAVHTTVFERLIAMTRDKGNIGYLLYLVDTVGYMGYIVLMFGKNYLQPANGFLPFFLDISLYIGGIGILAMLAANVFFSKVKPVADQVNAGG
jgi:hypothetical protein